MWMSLKELAGYAQQDAHEFFISALNNIHAGCEESKLSNCECIIHKTFSGLLQSTVTCLRCKNTTTTYDPMLDISLGLKAPEKKKKHLGNGRRHSHEDRRHGNTLADCLERFNLFFFESLLKLIYCIRYTQPERLGTNVYSCSKCGNTFQVRSFSLFLKVLIYTIFW